MPRFLFGAHTGVAGGLHNGLIEGAEIGCDTIQIFTSSPRQWAAKPLTDDAIALWKAKAAETKLSPLIAHDSYLINLASPDPETRQKSLSAFIGELERGEALGLDYLVSHPGAHVGSGEEAGIAQIAASLEEVHRATAGFKIKVALETTAAKGTTLGGVFEHFPAILSRVAEPERIVVCLDTCHIYDAGYDLVGDPTGVWDNFAATVGFEKLKIIHANDSKFGLASKRDQHAHIGEGTIGDAGFVAFLSDPRLPESLALIVETPVDDDKGHRENITKLRQLLN
ncbi:deoxyribonuclease IV [Armatimonas sp.]|uniref:deoxyribonuclease IV n=1 Tax=Armatimonas sp. TaxID=1872638 RepID=UPI0037517507